MAEARAEIVITARDMASQQFRTLAQNVQQMNAAFERTDGARGAVTRFAQELGRFTDDGRKAVGQVTDLRDKMVRVGEAFASGQMTASQAARAMKEIAEEAGKSAKGVNDLGSANQALKTELERVAQEAGQDAETFRKLAESQREAEERARKLGEAYQTLGTQARNIGLAFGGLAALGVAAIKSTAELAGRVETLGVVMNVVGENAGYSQAQLAGFEQRIREAGITTQVARETVIQMARANLDLSKSYEVARAAQDAAVIAGINSSEALQRIIYGVTTLNTRVLRTMGVMVDFRHAQEEFAKSSDRSTLSLSSQEKQAIALDEFLRKSVMISGAYTSAMDTVGKKVTSLARFHEEAALAIGNAFLPAYGGVVDVLTAALQKFNAMEKEQKEGVGTALGYATAISGVQAAYFLLIAQIPGLIKLVHDLGAAFKLTGTGIATSAGAVGLALAAWTWAGIEIVKTLAMIEAGEQAVRGALKEHGAEVLKTAKTYEEYRAEMVRAAKVAGMLVDAEGDLIRVSHSRGIGVTELTQANYALTQSEFEYMKVLEKWPLIDEAARAQARLSQGTRTLSDELTEGAEKWDLVAAKMLLQTSLTGQVGQAQEKYAEKLGKLQEKQADLTAEIEKYTAAQGQLIPVSEKINELMEDRGRASLSLEAKTLKLQIAEAELAEATAKLGAAQQALNENINPEKVEGLTAAISKAELAVAKKQAALIEAKVAVSQYGDKVDDLTAKIGSGNPTIAEYTAKLEELRGKYAENEEALRLLTAAHDEEINRIIFGIAQQALYNAMKAAGRDVTVEQQLALLEEARQLGLVDEATYSATQRMLLWAQGVVEGSDSIDNLNIKVGAARDTIADRFNPAVETGTGKVSDFRDRLMDAKEAAIQAADKANALTGAINAIPSYKRIDIEYFETTYRQVIETGTITFSPTGVERFQPEQPPILPKPKPEPKPEPKPKPPTPRERRGDERFRQHGGPVSAGQAYIVGERGPELFTPSRSGMILPNFGGLRLALTVPLFLDGREVGRASVDGTLAELRARGLAVVPVA